MKNHTSIEPLEPRIAPATLFVTTTADSGGGSLRKAIIEANATPAADIIAFKLPANSNIVLTSCRVSNKSGKLRAIKSGKFSLIMRDLERRRVEKDDWERVV